MSRSSRPFVLALGALLVPACTFGGAGGLSGGQGIGDSAEDGMDDAVATGSMDDDGDDGAPDDDGTPDDDAGDGPDGSSLDDDDGPTPVGAVLVLTGVTEMDGTVEAATPFEFQLRNEGGSPATNIESMATGDPSFVFEGGFPGPGGDCGPVLPSGGVCSIDLQFKPFTWGVFTGVLGVTYDGGAVGEESIMLEARGGGLTGNLLANPGFETGLEGWQPTPSSWGTVFDQDTGSDVATAGSSQTPIFTLTQEVDLSDWGEFIDLGAVAAPIGVTHRAGAALNDPHSIRVVFLDGTGATMMSMIYDSNGGAAWGNLEWEESSDVAPVPMGARAARVTLNCLRNVLGGSTCSGFFDDTNLQLQFPVE
ncbi:MAG: hypothetical protein AAF721_03185 [Myxococcota bacterium]